MITYQQLYQSHPTQKAGSTLKDLFNNTSVNDIIAFIKNIYFYTRISLLYLFYIAISLGFNNLFLLEYYSKHL